MKKTYILPVSKFAEFEEEVIIATSPSGDIRIGSEEGAGAGDNGGTDEVKKFIDFSDDTEW